MIKCLYTYFFTSSIILGSINAHAVINNQDRYLKNKQTSHKSVHVLAKDVPTIVLTTASGEYNGNLGGTITLIGTFTFPDADSEKYMAGLQLDTYAKFLFNGVPIACSTLSPKPVYREDTPQWATIGCTFPIRSIHDEGSYKVHFYEQMDSKKNPNYTDADSNVITITVNKYAAPTLNNPTLTYPNLPSSLAFEGDVVKLQAKYDLPSNEVPPPKFEFQNCAPESASQSSINTRLKSNTHVKSETHHTSHTNSMATPQSIECVHTVTAEDVTAGNLILGIKVVSSDYYNAGSAFTTRNITVSGPLSTSITLNDIPQYLEKNQVVQLNATVRDNSGSGFNPQDSGAINFSVIKDPNGNPTPVSPQSGNDNFKLDFVGEYTFQAHFVPANARKFQPANSPIITRNVQNADSNTIVAVGATRLNASEDDTTGVQPLLFEKKAGTPWQKYNFQQSEGKLNDVACNKSGAICVAIGRQKTARNVVPILYYKKGSEPWQNKTFPYEGALKKVKCVENDSGTRTSCIAVGYYYDVNARDCNQNGVPAAPIPLILMNDNLETNSEWVEQTTQKFNNALKCGILSDIDCTKNNSFCSTVGELFYSGHTLGKASIPFLISTNAPFNQSTPWSIYYDSNVANLVGVDDIRVGCADTACMFMLNHTSRTTTRTAAFFGKMSGTVKWEEQPIISMPQWTPRLLGMDCRGGACFVSSNSMDSQSSSFTSLVIIGVLDAPSVNAYQFTRELHFFGSNLDCSYYSSSNTECMWAGVGSEPGVNSERLVTGALYFRSAAPIVTSVLAENISAMSLLKTNAIYCPELGSCMIVGSYGNDKTFIATNLYSGVWENLQLDPTLENGVLLAIDGSKKGLTSLENLKKNKKRKEGNQR